MPQSNPARHSITFILEIRLKRVVRGLSTRYCSEMLFGITILKRTLFVRVPYHMLHITNNSIKPNNNILVTYSIHQLTPLHLWHSPLDEPNGFVSQRICALMDAINITGAKQTHAHSSKTLPSGIEQHQAEWGGERDKYRSLSPVKCYLREYTRVNKINWFPHCVERLSQWFLDGCFAEYSEEVFLFFC